MHGIKPAPDDDVAVEGQDALARLSELVISPDVAHRILAHRLGPGPPEDHAPVIVVGLNAGDVGMGEDEVDFGPRLRDLGRKVHGPALDVIRLPVVRIVPVAVVAAEVVLGHPAVSPGFLSKI